MVAAQGLTKFVGAQVRAPARRSRRRSSRPGARSASRMATCSRSASRVGAARTGRSGATRRSSRRSRPVACPAAWKPLDTTTEEEAVFLSPLDPVRGRAEELFGFHYRWEVYTPAAETQIRLLRAARPVARHDRGALRREAGPSGSDASRSSACGWKTRRWPETTTSPRPWLGGWPGSWVSSKPSVPT